MKKLLILITTIFVCFTLFLSGCSCAGEQTLSFGGYFYGDSMTTPSVGYKEYTEYKVSFKKASDFNTAFCSDCDFNGTYSLDLTVLSSYDSQALKTPQTDIYVLGENNSLVYKLVSKLDVHSSYVIDGKPCEYDDYIYRDAYFFPTDKGLMPIFVREETKTGIPSSTEEKYANFLSETLYENDKYSVTTKNLDTEEIVKNESFNYSKRTLIDNAELLFALRNITDSTSIPVVTPSYGKQQLLAIEKGEDSTYSCNIDYNDANGNLTVTSTIDVKTFAFRLADNKTSGGIHVLKIQKAKSALLPYKSFITYYSQPFSIMFYDGVLPTNLGNLEFNLTKIIL